MPDKTLPLMMPQTRLGQAGTHMDKGMVRKPKSRRRIGDDKNAYMPDDVTYQLENVQKRREDI